MDRDKSGWGWLLLRLGLGLEFGKCMGICWEMLESSRNICNSGVVYICISGP